MPVRARVAAIVMTNRNISYTSADQGAKESTATDAVLAFLKMLLHPCKNNFTQLFLD